MDKFCKNCNKLRDIQCFSINTSRKDGYSFYCRDCDWYLSKISKHKKWIQKRLDKGLFVLSEKICEECQEIKSAIDFRKAPKRIDGLYNICLECSSKINNDYVHGNDIDRRKARAKLRALNKDNINNKARESYYRCRSPETRLKKSCSKAIRIALKNSGYKKDSSILKHLPYSIKELKTHLESQFEPWMNWNNWGRYIEGYKTWQIDHIVPQSKLPYTSMYDENFKKCWKLENLQPLETIKNIIKSNKC